MWGLQWCRSRCQAVASVWCVACAACGRGRIRDILPWLLVESLLGLVPLAWLFRGHFAGAANTPSAHGTFRTLCLAQTTVWFVHACLFAFNALTAGAYVPDHENLR